MEHDLLFNKINKLIKVGPCRDKINSKVIAILLKLKAIY